jgi:hypothetical protein
MAMPRRPGIAPSVVLLALAGCASGPPLRPEGQRLTPLVTATADQAGVRALGASVRAALCERLAGSPDHPCEKVITRMGGEPEADGKPFPLVAEQAKAFRIGIVPGFFAECLDDEARPFAAAAKELRAQGFEVTYLPTTGRGSVAINAEMLAKEIAALVGIGGASYGSPLADRYEDLWRATFMSMPFGNCTAGQGEGVHDLRKDVRVAWWKEHGRQVHVPLYSIVGLPEKDRVSPSLAASHGQLSDIDARNDGQLIWTEAVAVPGALLGYVNADHWALAMRLSQAFPILAASFVDDVPRGAMLGAAIAVVAGDLQAGSTGR